MAAVWMRVSADLRRNWLGIIAVGLLAGVAAGVVLTAVAGARRTDSTLARVVAAERVPDVLVNPDSSDLSPEFLNAYGKIDGLPGIKSIGGIDGVIAVPIAADGKPDLDAINEVDVASTSNTTLDTVSRPHLIAGRYPDPQRADEILINPAKARHSHLAVGDRIHLGVFNPVDLYGGARVPKPRFVDDFVVTGIGLTLDDAGRAADDPHLIPTVNFTAAFDRRISSFTAPYVGKAVVLEHGARDVPEFEAAVRKLFDGVKVDDERGNRTQVNMNFQETSLTVARARRALRPYVLALWLFATLAALAALAVVGQAIARSAQPLRVDRERLAALGFTRRQIVASAAFRGLAIGLVAAIIAGVGAAIASLSMPIGPLRVIDPERGIDVDLPVFFIGIVLVVALIAIAGAWSVRPRRPVTSRTASVVGDQLAKSGAPLPVVSGVRFALDPGRDASVPLRSTLIGITVAIAALVASVVYSAGLNRFVTTPTRYGWPWSFQVVVDSETTTPAKVAKAIAPLPGVGASTLGEYSQFDIRGHSVAAVGIDPKAGVAPVPVITGRAPVADDEIALGEKTLEDLHAHIGDVLTVHAQSRTRDFRVVGTGVFGRFAPYPGSEPTGLGIGAATTARAVTQLGAQNGQQFLLVQTAPDSKLTVRDFERATGDSTEGAVVGPQRPNDVMSYDHLSRTPLLLAGALVLLALGSAIHLLVTSVRSRRRDVALLKTMGATRGQARTAVLVQATVLVGAALVVALPAGVFAGRWLWVQTAQWLGIASDIAIPAGALGAIVLVAFVLANAIAFGPAASAARTRPAVALRSE